MSRVRQRHENAKNGVKFRCVTEHDAKFFGVISQDLVITKGDIHKCRPIFGYVPII